jgi:hypothetical protein
MLTSSVYLISCYLCIIRPVSGVPIVVSVCGLSIPLLSVSLDCLSHCCQCLWIVYPIVVSVCGLSVPFNGIDNPETLTTMGTPDTGRIQNKNKNNKQTNTQHNRDNFKYEQHGHHKKHGDEQLFLNSKNGQNFSNTLYNGSSCILTVRRVIMFEVERVFVYRYT